MRRPVLEIPGGVWAIASDVDTSSDTQVQQSIARVVQAITLRRPLGDPRQVLECLRELRQVSNFVAVHGHADLAVMSGAQAVIAGNRSLPLHAYRDHFPQLLLGASTHDEVELKMAVDQGADFLIYGPVWDTPEKMGVLEPRGLRALELACAYDLPVIAIGGILSAADVQQCRGSGAHGVAVMRAAREPEQLAELITAAAE